MAIAADGVRVADGRGGGGGRVQLANGGEVVVVVVGKDTFLALTLVGDVLVTVVGEETAANENRDLWPLI